MTAPQSMSDVSYLSDSHAYRRHGGHSRPETGLGPSGDPVQWRSFKNSLNNRRLAPVKATAGSKPATPRLPSPPLSARSGGYSSSEKPSSPMQWGARESSVASLLFPVESTGRRPHPHHQHFSAEPANHFPPGPPPGGMPASRGGTRQQQRNRRRRQPRRRRPPTPEWAATNGCRPPQRAAWLRASGRAQRCVSHRRRQVGAQPGPGLPPALARAPPRACSRPHWPDRPSAADLVASHHSRPRRDRCGAAYQLT